MEEESSHLWTLKAQVLCPGVPSSQDESACLGFRRSGTPTLALNLEIVGVGAENMPSLHFQAQWWQRAGRDI